MTGKMLRLHFKKNRVLGSRRRVIDLKMMAPGSRKQILKTTFHSLDVVCRSLYLKHRHVLDRNRCFTLHPPKVILRTPNQFRDLANPLSSNNIPSPPTSQRPYRLPHSLP